jgi:hypothetical protein
MNEMTQDLKDKVDSEIHDFYWKFRDDVNDQGGEQLKELMEELRARIPYIMARFDTDDSRFTEPYLKA